jgi:uncharacterized protein YdeI (YjbR/CyaY-like superfamily)
MNPTFFRTPVDFRKWLEKNHEKVPELLVGFYKKGSGKPSITWPESVDEALCFGWIDGIRRTIDDESYTIRFTPRRARSMWSAVNVKRVAELTKLGHMQAAGLRAFEGYDPKRSEQKERKDVQTLGAEYQAKLEGNAKAWTFFQAQAPYYRRAVSRWVMSARKEETRLSRLATLIDDSAHGRRIKGMTRPEKANSGGKSRRR